MEVLSGHEHHESPAVANVVVGQAESCLLRGIYGSQLDGYAVHGPREQPRAEAPSSLRQRVLVTPGVLLLVLLLLSLGFRYCEDPLLSLPGPFPPWSCRIPNAPVSTLDLSIRERS